MTLYQESLGQLERLVRQKRASYSNSSKYKVRKTQEDRLLYC